MELRKFLQAFLFKVLTKELIFNIIFQRNTVKTNDIIDIENFQVLLSIDIHVLTFRLLLGQANIIDEKKKIFLRMIFKVIMMELC